MRLFETAVFDSKSLFKEMEPTDFKITKPTSMFWALRYFLGYPFEVRFEYEKSMYNVLI